MRIDVVMVSPQTAAVANTASTGVDATGYREVVIHADNLATTEEVDIYMNSNGSKKPVYNYNASAAAVLTATAPAIALLGGLEYFVAKDATAGSCGVYATCISPTT